MNDQELCKAKVAEEIAFWQNRNLSPTADDKVEVGVVVVKTDYLISRLTALEAVLAMPIIPDIGTVTGIEDAINHGRNSALSEVHSLIASALGGGGE